jgi:hypothetical protein
MKKMFVFGLIAFAALVYGIFSNYIGYLRFGKSFNDTRIELGIPVIEETFKPADDYLFWYNESRNYPRHAMKQLTTSGLSLEIEQDNFEFVKDSVVVTAYCYYHYKEKCCNIYLSEGDGPGKKISCEKLVELLREQGLSVKMNCQECLSDK